MTDKHILRKKYLEIRKNIRDKETKSTLISKKVLATAQYKTAKRVAIYYNLPSEVETKCLIEKMLEANKEVYLPVVLNDNQMDFYKITSLKDIKIKNTFGIYEPPLIEENKLNKSKLDLIIIPGVCFDKEKNRVGFGKGYYDTYLENTSVYKMALAFTEQITTDHIKTTTNDIKMDIVLTDTINY